MNVLAPLLTLFCSFGLFEKLDSSLSPPPHFFFLARAVMYIYAVLDGSESNPQNKTMA